MFRLWLETQEDWQKFMHQKEFPFMRQKNNPFVQYAKSVIPDYEDYFDRDDDVGYYPDKLYHVTTNLSGVKISMGLKSRAQLGGAAKTSGLGGGAINESPHKISLTYSFYRAKEIYSAILYVVAICHGKIKASQVYDYLNVDQYHDEFEKSSVDNVLEDYIPEKLLLNGDEEKIKRYLDKKVKTPLDVYNFFQDLEMAIVHAQDRGSEYADYVTTYDVIGFTADFNNMFKINPNNVAIIQCLVRKNADGVEHVPGEVEVRVKPQDVTVIRYMQP